MFNVDPYSVSKRNSKNKLNTNPHHVMGLNLHKPATLMYSNWACYNMPNYIRVAGLIN